MDPSRVNAEDLDDARTGVVRHFKQQNVKGGAELEAALEEARESQALSLEDFRLREMPDEVYATLPDLGLLAVGWNLLTSLDVRVCKLAELKVLDLTHNYVTQLPKEIELLVNLKVLNAGYNELKVLPEEIGRLANLQELHVHFNALNELPASICNLTKLRTLRL